MVVSSMIYELRSFILLSWTSYIWWSWSKQFKTWTVLFTISYLFSFNFSPLTNAVVVHQHSTHGYLKSRHNSNKRFRVTVINNNPYDTYHIEIQKTKMHNITNQKVVSSARQSSMSHMFVVLLWGQEPVRLLFMRV